MSEAPSLARRQAANITFDARHFPPVSEDNPAARWSIGEPVLFTFPDGENSHSGNDRFIHTDPEVVQAIAQKLGVDLQAEQEEEPVENKPPAPTAAAPAPPEGIADTDVALAVCLAPDICLTPIGSSVVPIPYQVYGKAGDDDSYSPDVFFNGFRAMRFDSRFSRTYGDEPGVCLGVISGTQGDIVEPTSHSTIVRINGHPAVRHGDGCTLNNGNTVGEMIFVRNRMIAPPPPGDASDAEEAAQAGGEESEEAKKPQYQRPGEREVGPSLTGGHTRSIGEESSRQRNPDGTRQRSHTLHRDKRETEAPSVEAEYEFFNEKIGVVKDKLLVDGEYGNVDLNVLTTGAKASATAAFGKDGVDIGASAGASASSVKVEGIAGNDYIAGSASLEGPAARIGGEGGVRISKDSVTAKLEGEIGVSLLEGEVGLDLATPAIFGGWGAYISCEATGGAGIGAKGVASFDTVGKKKGATVGAKGAFGLSLGLQCSFGVHSED